MVDNPTLNNGLPEVDEIVEAAYQQGIKLFGGSIDWNYNPFTGQFHDNTTNHILDFEFHPKDEIFITSTGVTLKFNRYNQTFLQAWRQAYIKKHEPAIPKIAIEYEEGKYYLQGNQKDEAYQHEYERFTEALGTSAMQVMFSLAVKNETPSPETWNEAMNFFLESVLDPSEKLSPYAEKFYWLMSLMPSNSEMLAFMHIVQGMDMPLVEDIEKAIDRFPGASE